jgi:hypothetical protein
MNAYPSWIHRIPEMIETLALADRERIDRQTVERLFDLRKTAAFQLLRRMGAEPVGHSLAISRTLLMARLWEAHEHPHWHWERERRSRIRERIDQLRPANRKSIVPVTPDLRERMEALAIGGLPESIRFDPGRLTITCRDLEHLVEQLVLVARSLDSDYATLKQRIEQPARKQPGSDLRRNSEPAEQAS